jgi:hypothetical protein
MEVICGNNKITQNILEKLVIQLLGIVSKTPIDWIEFLNRTKDIKTYSCMAYMRDCVLSDYIHVRVVRLVRCVAFK